MNSGEAVPSAPSTALPSAQEILSRFKTADSPLEFIKANLEATKPPLSVDPPQVIKEVETKRADEAKVEAEKKEDASLSEMKLDLPLEVSKTSDVKGEEALKDETLEEPKDDKEENFKNLRKKLHETTTTLRDREREAEALKTRITKYETGEELPEVLRVKEERIRELEKYEKLHALKLSPAYRETFIKPIEGIKSRLSQIAKDYEIPPEILTEAIDITNVRELNTFLSNHFDDVGALEAKQLISEAQKIKTQALAAEKEPSNVLTEIEESYKTFEAQKRAKANSVISETSKEAWIDSLIRIKDEGKIQELISKEDDPEHNKRFVEPVLQAAATEYGKLIRTLAENGLEKLPKDLAFALARMVHLAHASAVSIESRHAAEIAKEELERNVRRTTSYLRPTVGTSSHGNTQGESPRPTSPQDAAKMLVNTVLSKRVA